MSKGVNAYGKVLHGGPPGVWYPWAAPCQQGVKAIRKDWVVERDKRLGGNIEEGWAWGFVAPAEFFDMDAHNPQSVCRVLKNLSRISKEGGCFRAWVSDLHVKDRALDITQLQWLLHRERAFKTKEEAIADFDENIALIDSLGSMQSLREFAATASREWHVPSARIRK